MSQNKNHVLLYVATLLILVSTAVVPANGYAQIAVSGDLGSGSFSLVPAKLSSLDAFIQQVENGSAQEITGLYVKNLFSYPVIQQPGDQPAFVSSAAGMVTQFQQASYFGSLGFVAHNTLAGMLFPQIKNGDLISVVYGDGHYKTFQVKQIRSLQALQPSDPFSTFVDLSNHKTLSVEDIFYQTYGVKDQLILQTCISYQGIDSWGRLFIIAVPFFPAPARTVTRAI